MSDSAKIREAVSDAYDRAITQAVGCCGSTPGGGTIETLATGYTGGELADLPQGVAQSSFGCGNPLAFSEVGEGEVVLDLGSGAGMDLLLAAKRVGPQGRIIGVDMTDAMIERARANLREAGVENAEVRKGIIEELPVETGSVDWVISNCVINLSPEKSRVFAEIARVLKPGGRVSVSDIVVKDMPDWARESQVLYSACVAGAISEDAYVDGMRAAGLTDVEVRERYVYDASQIAGFAASGELTEGAPSAPSACCGGGRAENANAIAEALVGKVWSAKFFARKAAL